MTDFFRWLKLYCVIYFRSVNTFNSSTVLISITAVFLSHMQIASFHSTRILVIMCGNEGIMDYLTGNELEL